MDKTAEGAAAEKEGDREPLRKHKYLLLLQHSQRLEPACLLGCPLAGHLPTPLILFLVLPLLLLLLLLLPLVLLLLLQNLPLPTPHPGIIVMPLPPPTPLLYMPLQLTRGNQSPAALFEVRAAVDQSAACSSQEERPTRAPRARPALSLPKLNVPMNAQL
jgi:hypothetical protein